ncbi:MAG TPA: LuxR C-terminal-related transcriptional regulator [Ktedonobacterales bacterium]|nr:LuxR C-terminal-related transcriptional regulator [Ktedonobacterales bacterium]
MTRLPIVRDDTLLTEPPVRVGSDSWYAWLDKARSFAYHDGAGRFTARHEERAGSSFWYAYRRQGGVLRKTYLGRSMEITAERLHDAAHTLAQMGDIDSLATIGAANNANNANDAWHSPLIATKIAAPQPAQSLISRQDVLSQCRQSIEHPCTIIAAPAGFGKTTLLMMASEQVRSQGWQVAWVTLEESEQDPTRFWQYTLAAIDHAQPGISATARHLLEIPRPAPVDRMLTVLINDLATAPTPILLVLDDYHRAATPAIDQGLIFLIEHAPATLHLLVATRSTPAFSLARLRVQGRITELDAADLRFSTEEANRFMRETMRVSLPPDQLARLERRTEGWVAGLQLAALSLRNQTNDQATTQGSLPELDTDRVATPRYIAEYLIDEVLERQPDDVQTFLLQTAPLERLSGPLCDAVTGRDDSAAVLAYLTRAQLFVTPLDAAQTWYRYHHLFAEVLRERLHRRMPDSVNQCHQRAADWLWRHGMADDAIRHLLAAGQFVDAASRMEQQSDRLVLHGELSGLVRWVRMVPRDIALAHPHLCVLFAVALLLQGEEPESAAWLDALEKRHAKGNALQSETAAEIMAVRSFMTLWSGDVAGGARLAQEAARQLPPDDQLLRGLTLWISSVIGIFGEGNMAEVVQTVGELAEASRRSGNMLVAFMALVTKAGALLYLCQLREAARICDDSLHLLPVRGDQESPIAAMAYCIQGEIHREWNELDVAESTLRRALAIGDRLGSPEFINDGLLYLALVQCARGQNDEALATLDRIRVMVQARQLAPWDLTQMEIIRARVLVSRGSLDEATRWAEDRLRSRRTREPGSTGLLVFVSDLEDLAIARIALARGDTDAAFALLEPLRERTENIGQWRNLMETHILLARAHWMTGATESALCDLHAALTIAAPDRFMRVFLDEGDTIADLLTQYTASHSAASPSREATRELAHARAVLAAFGRANAEGAVAPPDLLSAREVDVLRLLATGRSNEAIASEMVLALSTVKWHIAHIYRKLGVDGRMQAVARARELRLIA